MGFDPYSSTMMLQGALKLVAMAILVYGMLYLPKKLKAWWSKRQRMRKAALERRKLEREKERMGSKRERYVHQTVADIICEGLEEAWLSNRLSMEEKNRYYRRFAHAMKMNDLLPRKWTEALKERIKLRLATVYKKDPDVLLAEHRKKHPVTEGNVVRGLFGADVMDKLKARKETKAA